jgi:phosphoribosyl 1,2-cyclic phosphodiesterase
VNLRFWGVRAELAIPGPTSLRYGGHTLCTTVTDDEGNLCILDAGFGLTQLGHELMAEEFGQGQGNALILFSHFNWDHTHGIGFFLPFYRRGNRFTFYGLGSQEFAFFDRLEAQLIPSLSPLQTLNHLEAQLSFRESDKEGFWWGDIHVRSHLMPAGVEYGGGFRPLVFHLSHDGRSLIYVSEAEYPDGQLPDEFVEFCRGANLLIHDAYWTADDCRPGWGHSPVELAVELARRAGIPRLALFHYNPAYGDDQIDEMIRACQAEASVEVFGAREGQELTL